MSLAENIDSIQQRIRTACERAGRNPESVTLLAVTKGQPPEVVNEAGKLGQIFFGENKIQEAKAKIPLCSGKLRWHFIGHLQTNKCREAVELFEMIQGVDSLHVAQEISRRADQAGKTVPILLEVNLAGEASKFGYRPETLEAELAQINALPRLEVHGFMTIPPWTSNAENVRPVFRQLREFKERAEQVIAAPLPHLSMGMSGDFEVAIEEGSTIVRVGTSLFGPRKSIKSNPTEF